MLIVISPAKSLDLDSPIRTRKHSEPRMLDRAAELVDVMAEKSPSELESMMSISPSLAEINFERFQDWERPFTTANARQALFTFNGDVYQGMEAPETFSERDLTHAQKTLRILSGLYGVLRPLDLMQPYRLEMGSSLATARGDDLYRFWGDAITDTIIDDLEASPGADALVNLASEEYFRSIDTDRIDARIVTPRFLDATGGRPPRVLAYFAKRARGAMAAWIIRNRVRSVRALRDFDGLGYRLCEEDSSPTEPVFVRTH